MNMTDLVVVFWTILMAIFLGFSVAILVVTRADLLEAVRIGDVEAQFIVEGRERRGIFRAIGWLALVGTGILILLPLDANSTPGIITVGLFIGPVALGSEEILELVDRVRFRTVRNQRQADSLALAALEAAESRDHS